MKTTHPSTPTASQAYIYIRLSSQAQAWGDGERRQHDAALIKEGIPAWNTRKPVWHRSYIEKLLCNRAVVGEYIAEFKTDEGSRGQEVITGYYPAIVDQALFDRVQDMAFLRRKGQRGRKGKKFSNLFQKLARCSVCGATMGYHNATVDNTRKSGVRPWAHYLTCNSAHAGHGCSNRRYFVC